MESLLAKLESLSIAAPTIHHDAVVTAEEHSKVLGDLDRKGQAKNLFLKEKKKGDLYLICLQADRVASNKLLQDLLSIPKSSQLRMAEEDVLSKTLNVAQGNVSPFALINDTEHKVQLVLDKDLTTEAAIHLHPLSNSATTSISPANLLAFLKEIGAKTPIILDLDTAPAPEAAAAAVAKPAAKAKPAATAGGAAADAKKHETKLGIAFDKVKEFSEWYPQVLKESEMLSYDENISGCYVLRPWSYKIWQVIQTWFTEKIQDERDVDPCYFPCFVAKSALEKEKAHVEGFAAEVAWVTKSGDTDLQEPIALRPTSETVMYPHFSKWIRSHRDLPLKLNQWCNVVRWEFKNPTPFIRTREFLWQEGHTAHATQEEAMDEVLAILELYRRIYEELLAVPVIKGRKSENEKFAGGDMTTTIEGFLPANGRAIQAATSHLLGQNFAKMFDIRFEDEKGDRKLAWQTSWGCTTRSLGVMVMVHGDNKGLVLPPVVAPLQVVCIAIPPKSGSDGPSAVDLIAKASEISATLKQAGVRSKCDDRVDKTPGWKFNNWELKGVPIRLELGPRDLAAGQVRLVFRHNGATMNVPWEGLAALIQQLLVDIQREMYEKARDERDRRVIKVTDWKQVTPALNELNLVIAPWCEDPKCEDHVQAKTKEEAAEEGGDDRAALTGKAKTLCIPHDQTKYGPIEGLSCFAQGIGCTKPAASWCLWGRSY